MPAAKESPHERSARNLHDLQERVSGGPYGARGPGKADPREGRLPARKTRWLIKVAISAASGHRIALETHIAKAREAGASDDEIVHVLLLLIQTTGFPNFMEAYSVFRKMTADAC